jgi:prepilin-type N-terminal cleavage/methylation domain-containing protein
VSRPRRRGFSLVELLLAIIVLAIAVLGTGAAISSTSKLQRLSSRRAEMALLASAKLEEFRARVEALDATTVDNLKAPPKGSITTNVANYNETVTSPNGTSFLLRWQVTAGPALTERVTVRVLWPATGSATDQLDLVTYLLVPS